MKEYLIKINENCSSSEIWDVIKIIKPKVISLEVIGITIPIILVKTDEDTIKSIEQLCEVETIETNDRFGTWNKHPIKEFVADVIYMGKMPKKQIRE
jgi:hypothetical protein